MPHCMVPDCTNNSRKTAGISYHRVPAEKSLRQAWMVKIRRENPCSRENSFVCSEHFTPDSFEENLPGLVSGYRTRRRLKPDAFLQYFLEELPINPNQLPNEETFDVLDKRY